MWSKRGIGQAARLEGKYEVDHMLDLHILFASRHPIISVTRKACFTTEQEQDS